MRNRSALLGITYSEQYWCINPSRFFIPRRVWNTLLYHVGQPYPSRLFQVGQCYSEQVILSRAPLFRVGIPSTAALGKPFQNRNIAKSQNLFFLWFLENFVRIQPQSGENKTEKPSYLSQIDFVTINLVETTTRPNSGFRDCNHVSKHICFVISKCSKKIRKNMT